MNITSHLHQGIAVIALAVVLSVLKDRYIDVGESYVSVLDVFQNKPRSVIVVVGVILITAILSSVLQGWVVEQLQRPGMLQIGLGGVVLASYHYVHYEVEDWNAFDGTLFMYGLHAVSAILILAGMREAGLI